VADDQVDRLSRSRHSMREDVLLSGIFFNRWMREPGLADRFRTTLTKAQRPSVHHNGGDSGRLSFVGSAAIRARKRATRHADRAPPRQDPTLGRHLEADILGHIDG
jgi:hypothetical protein